MQLLVRTVVLLSAGIVSRARAHARHVDAVFGWHPALVALVRLNADGAAAVLDMRVPRQTAARVDRTRATLAGFIV